MDENDYYMGKENIPQEYMSQINDPVDTTVSDTYIQGELGEKTMLMGLAFNNSSNIYFGHGTIAGNDIIQKIINEGLYVKNPESSRGYSSTLRGLHSTTIKFGLGSENLFKQNRDELNNWPHKNSRNIIIVSLPKKYICDKAIDHDPYEAYYLGDEENGCRLRPEFIMGVYNADKGSMTINKNYYTNLSQEEQKELFDKVEERYAVSNYSYYLKPQREQFTKDENYKKATLLWYKFHYKRELEKEFHHETPDIYNKQVEDIDLLEIL